MRVPVDEAAAKSRTAKMRKVTRAILQRVCMGGLAAPSRGMAALSGNVVLSSKKSEQELGVGRGHRTEHLSEQGTAGAKRGRQE